MLSSHFTLLFTLTLLCLHTCFTRADRSHADTCGLSCVYFVSTLTFADYNATVAAELEYYGTYCSSPLFAESFALCLNQYCKNPSKLYTQISNEYCGALGLASFDGISFADALKTGSFDAVPYESLNISEPVTVPFEASQETFSLWFHTVNEFYRQLDLGTTYGGALLAYIGGFILFGIIRNAVVTVITSFFNSKTLLAGRPSRPMRVFQRYIVYPATFSVSHLQRPKILGITFTLPTRAQSWIVFGYCLLALILSCTAWTNVTFDENVWWPADEVAQIQRYLADRSGVMAISQLPFVFLFAGRNNILLYLTGWSYQTFNVYHKWTGRVMWALAVIHGVTYTVTSVRDGYLTYEYAETYWRWGVVAVISASFTIFLGIHNFRQIAYEVFLVIHIVLVGVFIGAMWWHCNTLGWMQYIYCSIAVWAFDRVVRLVRVAYFNVGWAIQTKAEISVVDGNADGLLLIKISAVRKAIATPGQYFFLHIGTIAPWSAHPFTILEQDGDGRYILIARVHKGLTEKLYKRALTASPRANPMAVTDGEGQVAKCIVSAGIDGLYGRSAPVQAYDSVLLIAGGVGITGCYPYIKYISQHKGRATRHIKLVWVVRKETNINWLRPRLQESLQSLAPEVALDIEIYVTSDAEGEGLKKFSPVADSESSSLSGRDAEKVDHTTTQQRFDENSQIAQARPNSPVVAVCRPSEDSIRTLFGRPNLAELVKDNVENAPSSVAVLLCGPASMADDVRYHIHHNIERARGRLDYFEEALEW